MAQEVVGPALPAVRLSGGYFADRDPLDTAFGNLIMALMCPIGGRVMRRSFGSELERLLYDPADAVLAAAVRATVNDTAKKFVPTIRIADVVVRVNGNTVELNIKFSLSSDRTNERTKQMIVPRRQAIQFLSARSN